MLLRQSGKAGIKDYTVSTRQQARDIVGLMNITYTHATAYFNWGKGNITFLEALEDIIDQHEIYGVMKEMLLDFGNCIFTLILDNGNELIMNIDFIQFEKPERVAE